MKKKYFLLLIIVFQTTLTTAQVPNWQWANSFGSSGHWESAEDLCIDASGNIYITGYFNSSSLIFGTDTLTNNGSDDVFVVKYDVSGNVIWAMSAGGNSEDWGKSISVDTIGNIYITGYFRSSIITFGNTTLTNAGIVDIFIVKYDPNGVLIWAKSAGGPDYDESNCISVGKNGDAWLIGKFYGTNISFDTITLTSMGNPAIFIVKFNTMGNVVWAKSAGGTGGDWGKSISLDQFGNAYATGVFGSSSVTFGSETLNNTGCVDIFLVKYNSAGDVMWAKSVSGKYCDESSCIRTSANGNSYITGTFNSDTIAFDTLILTKVAGRDIFVVKYDESGNAQWAKSAGGTLEDFSYKLCLDENEYIYVTGAFNSPQITFGSYTLTNVSLYGVCDIFTVKYNDAGNIFWAKSVGDYISEVANGICVDNSESVYLTGEFRSLNLDFDGIVLINTDSSTNYSDIFIAKLDGTTTGNSVKKTPCSEVTIFPDPVSGIMTIENHLQIKDATILIYNLQGQLFLTGPLTQDKTKIDVSGFAKGVYFLKIQFGKEFEVKKFVKID